MSTERDVAVLPPASWIHCDEDGCLSVTWCVGEQGAPDSWRLCFFGCPGEGYCWSLHDRANVSQNFGEVLPEDVAQRLIAAKASP